MPQVFLNENAFYFPPVDNADEDGLLIIGGRVTPARIVEGYSKGIFPWYNEDEWPLWWSPDPRFVLVPGNLHISNSMQKLLKKKLFRFKINFAFETVIENCASTFREGQDGTWINPEIKRVYTELHHMGIAHSAEAWLNNQLVGGVYGILLGNVFFGESMFSKVDNASKFAFINYVQFLAEQGIELVDCQVYTKHLETLGATNMDRQGFIDLLQKLIA